MNNEREIYEELHKRIQCNLNDLSEKVKKLEETISSSNIEKSDKSE